MLIENIIRQKQPDVYKELQQKFNYKFSNTRDNNKNNKGNHKENILELMGVNRGRYKRAKGGAIKQL
ncbi:MAG: hypothetical protein RR645_02985 [Clostridium sp.]